MSLSYVLRLGRRAAAAAMAGAVGLAALPVALNVSEVPASATSEPTPLIYFDATNPASYPGTGTTWFDLSGNNAHGTLSAVSIQFESTNSALNFPGGTNGSAYVDLPGDFADFTNGLTIEFEGHFGNTASWFERIFDFAADPPSGRALKDSIFVSRFMDVNELAVGLYEFNPTTSANDLKGHCHTATDETAITPTPTFQKWLISVDSSGLCRIYRNGVELGTRIEGPTSSLSTSSAQASPTGSAFFVPRLASRPFAFLGRSSYPTDNDLEGAIRYLRIYNQALTPQQAAANATATVTFTANGGFGSMAQQSSTVSATLNPNAFSRPYHHFLGWNTAADGTGIDFDDEDTYPFASDVTLYAQWQFDPSLVPPALPLITTTTTTPPTTTTTTTPTTTEAPATTTPVDPASAPVPDTGGELPVMTPGRSQVTENGVGVPADVAVDADGTLQVQGDDFALRVQGAASGSTVVLEPGGTARVSGFGFQPGSLVHLWLFSDPTYLGALPVAVDGTFDGSLPVPLLADGEHTLQANGITSDGERRTTNVGVVVRTASAPQPVVDTLPSTGSTSGSWLVIIATVLALGGLALTARRRSGPQHSA